MTSIANPDHIRDNADIFDFTLTDDDMAKISSIDRRESSFFSHYDPKMVEWFVKMVEERKTKHRSEDEKKAW